MGSLGGSGGIFISYRREETAAQAGRLYDHLSNHFGETAFSWTLTPLPSVLTSPKRLSMPCRAVISCSLSLGRAGLLSLQQGYKAGRLSAGFRSC